MPAPATAIPEPEHPFRAANTAYVPLNVGNVSALPDRNNAACKEPAYRMLLPIHDANIAADVYNRSLNAPVTITQRELLSLVPEVRSQYRDTTMTRHQPNKDAPAVMTNLFENVPAPAPASVAQVFSFIEAYDPEDKYYKNLDYSQFVNADSAINGQLPPKGASIANNHFDIYYRNLSPGDCPDLKLLVVTLDSSAIRSMHAIIDGTLRVECVIDPGSTIIMMLETQCTELSLAYDPTVILQMQSANGSINPSLGLAHNILFMITKTTLYLQVHIIRNPPYDILLGRPFDVITASIVHNYTNEDQTIMIHDPNTGQTVTVPTFPRTFSHGCTCCHHQAANPSFRR